MTLRLFLQETICRLLGHDPGIDPDGYPYCERCNETLLEVGQRRPF
jgi:hypothetical protein